jgi:hypothetical protein
MFVRQRSFYLVRTDGSETDFSFMKCLRPPTHRHSSPTFLQLAEEFAPQQGGWDEMVIARADGSIGVQLGRADQAKAWRDFHRENARLRLVSSAANLSLLRQGVKRNG